MGCFKHCRKWTVLIFNAIFLLIGLTLIIIGAIPINNLNHLDKTIPSSYRFFTATPIILLVLGSVIVLISVLGTIGVCKKNLFLLNSYTITLIVIFVLQISLSIVTFWAMSNQNDLAVNVNNTVDDVFKNHLNNTEVIDFMQTKLECCGTNGPIFWKNSTSNAFPKSCCEGEDCAKKVYSTGCQKAVYDFLLTTVRVVGTTILVLSPVQVIGATLSLSLVNSIRNYNRRYGRYTK